MTTFPVASSDRRDDDRLIEEFMAHLEFEKGMDHDPAAGLGTPRKPRSLPKALPLGDVERLVERPAADLLGRRDRAILETLYGAGLRISELVALDVDDLDLEEGSVRVMGKGSKERVVPLGRFAREALESYLTRARPSIGSARRSSELSRRYSAPRSSSAGR